MYTIIDSKEEIYLAKHTYNTRVHVVQLTITVEELISKTLGYLLDVDWKESKSFGYQSTSLSFNQKVQIIQDLRGIDKNYIRKFNDLMSIRNKFAHVSEVDSFKSLFTVAKNGETLENNFEKWYLKKEDSKELTDDYELKFKCLFSRMILDLGNILINISKEHAEKRVFEQGQRKTVYKLLEELTAALRELENGEEIIDTAILRVENDSTLKFDTNDK